MKRLFFNILCVITCIIFYASNVQAQQLTSKAGAYFLEDFEEMTGAGSNNYNGVTITFATGDWYIKGMTTMDLTDRYNGTRSIRLRGNATDVEHRVEMKFDKPNGAGMVFFKYGSYAAHSGGIIQLQISTDGGNTWQDKGDAITVPSWTAGGSALQIAAIPVNINGNIRVRIIKNSQAGNTTLNIDDIGITDFAVSTPTILTSSDNLDFGNVLTQENSNEKTVIVTGFNLTGNISYTKTGTNPSAFTITELAWSPATGGTLSITFSPTAAQTYSASIVFSSTGAVNETVSLTGTGIVPTADLYEDFEAAVWANTGYGERTVAGLKGEWKVAGVGTMDGNDRYHGIRSIRLRGNAGDNCRVEMNFDKTDGMGVVTFAYASYAAHSNGQISLYYSTDGGNGWISAGNVTAPAWGGAMLTATFTLNIEGNVRIKIVRDGNLAGSTSVNIDDITITDFGGSTPTPVIAVSPTSLSFGDVETGTTAPAKTITVSGSDLTGNITYVKGGTNPTAFTITETSWNPATGGTLSVTFSPTAEQNYSATIILSSIGAESKTVTLTGTGIVLTDFIWGDSFEYVAGTLLTANGWVAHSSPGSNPIAVAAGSLSYLNYAPSEVGNKAMLVAAAGEDVNHSFSSNVTSGILYAAFMVNVTDAKTAGDYFVHFMGQSSSVFSGKVFAKSSGSGYQLGISKAANTGDYADQILEYGTTYLGVIKYEIVAGTTNDLVSLFVNPVVGNPEPATASAVASDVTGTDPTMIMGFALRQGGASTTPALALDGIRVARTWNEAVKYLAMPVLTVAPTSWNFGNIETGTTSPAQTITVSGVNLTGNIAYIKGGTDPTAFTITENAWNPATGGTLNVTFSPTIVKNYSATITIVSVGATDKVVTLSGAGVLTVVPELVVNPTSLSFGDVETGVTSAAKTVAVSGTDLTGNITYVKGGANPTAFTITETPWNPATGGTLSVTFTPTAIGNYSATITISSIGAESKTVTLTGTGIAPSTAELVVKWNGYPLLSTTPSYTFIANGGSTYNNDIATLTRDETGAGFAVNADGVPVSTTWQNATTIDKYWITAFSTIGYKDLTFTSKQRGSDTGPRDFKVQYKVGAAKAWTDVADGTIIVANDNYLTGVKENHPLPTEMNNQEEVFLRWICTSTVAINGTTVAAGGVNRLDVTLYGEPTAPAPFITIGTTSWNFGSMIIGSTPLTKTIDVSAENLTGIISCTKSGTGAAAFNITPATLPATGGTFTITFNPATVGDFDATLTISSTGANDKIVTLSGKGVLDLVPTLVVAPTSLDFGNVNTGSTSPAKTITVSGTDLTGDISYVKGGADAAAFTVTETSWNPATGGTLSVTFKPTEVRDYSANIVLSSEDAESKTVTLTGKGITSASGDVVAKWNGYESGSHDPIFLATDGTPVNDGIATLTRDAAGAGYAVNADGVPVSTAWQDAETIDKYWITTFSTVGSTNLTFTSKQRGSNTGPKYFKVQYKIGAGAWTDVEDGAIVVENDNYITGVKENHPLPSAMSNKEEVFLRWICTSNESIGGGTVAAGGVNRLDVTIYGEETTPIPIIIANPANVNFGKVEVGTTPPPQTIAISGLNLTSNITWDKGGADASAFTVTANPWNPATGGTLTVTFAPTEERAYNATITLSSTGASNKVVNLTGTGMVPADFFEDFEEMDGSGSYDGKSVTFASGEWFIKGYTTMTTGSDRYNGVRSVRLRGNASDVDHRAEMMFDKHNGAGTVAFKYGSYAAHSGGELQLQISTDGGATWQDKGEVIEVPAWTGELLTASVDVNQEGDIRIRVIKVNAKANSTVNVDDIEITDFDSDKPNISVSPATIAFGKVEVQTTSSPETITVSGSNLTGNITYIKGGADASMFTITETAWNPATGGKLSVTFTPAEAKAYSATITFNSAGAPAKTVTLSGTGISGGIGCNGGFEEWTDGKPNCWYGDKTTFTKAGVVQYSDNVHGGNYACQLINTESGHKRFSTQPVTVIADKEYTITFWVRGRGEIRTALFDGRDGNNGYTPYNDYIFIDSDTWEKYSQVVTAETNVTNAEFIFSIRNTDESGDHIQIDDVEITTGGGEAIEEFPTLHCAVFPNPSAGTFNVTVNGNVNVRVYSLTGALLLEQPINEMGTINLEAYPAGIYIMKVVDEQRGCAVRKLVVR